MGAEGRVPFWRRGVSLPDPLSPKSAGAVLIGLWGFAFVHPVLGILGQAPAFFFAHDASGPTVIVWVIAVSTVPPLIMLGVYAALRPGMPRPATAFLAALVAALVAASLIPHIDTALALPMSVLGAVAAIVVTAAGVGFLASHMFRRLAGATWFSPLVFVALFSFSSPAADVVMMGSEIGEAVAAKPAGLVMIVLDEFPVAALLGEDLGIDRARFPGFAALADRSTWYRNTTTASVWTERAVPALLSGRNPRTAAFGDEPARDIPRNLFSMLFATHKLNAAESVSGFCDLPGCSRIEPGPVSDMYRATAVVALRAWAPEAWADTHLRSLGAGWSFLPGENRGTFGRLESLVSRLEAGKAGSDLWFTHTVLPHRPYQYLPGGYTYPGGWDEPAGAQAAEGYSRWHPDVRVGDLMRQRLLLQIQALDELIGRLAKAMDSGAIDEDTMVVVTADHGLSFDPDAHARGADLRESQIADIAAVPLFVRYPGQVNGSIVQAPSALIDVLPTIADVMEVEPLDSWDFDGRSLKGVARTTNRVIFDSHRAIQLPPRVDLAAAAERYRLSRASLTDPGYALGPLGERVGMAWRELDVIKSDVVGRLENAERFRDVDPAEAVPALVEVTLGSDEEAHWGLVAVNGVVAGTGPIYDHQGTKRLAAMVDPSLFANGANQIQVALTDDLGKSLRPVMLDR